VTALTRTLTDSATMLRRNFLRQRRYPVTIMVAVGVPLVILFLFVFVFGETLGSGLGGPAIEGGRAAYLTYVVPGILLMVAPAAAQGAAIVVAMDMTEGIIARFRTMAISRAAVLTGHVVGGTLQTVIGIVVVAGVALALGFRPDAGPMELLAALGVLVTVTFALTWLAVALGVASKTVEGASNSPMPLMLLPFLGSAFVPTASLPSGMRWFAEHQPFTPFNETLRGLLTGTEIGSSAWISMAWCAGIALVGFLWARANYEKRSVV
jgi:ABC-2 type transport system permease protein